MAAATYNWAEGSPANSIPEDAPYSKAAPDGNGLVTAFPHFYGRFSDGPVWSEHLAALLDMPLKSYAVGGAKVLVDEEWC